MDAGTLPTGLAAVEGSLWVASKGAQTLFRIDPAANRVVQAVNIGQDSCGQPVDAFGDLVTMPCNSSRSSVVLDGRSGRIRGTIPDSAGTNAAAGAGSIWIGSYDATTLKRVDPTTLEVEKLIRVESAMVAFDGEFIWSGSNDVTTHANGHLVRIDPATNRVVQRYRIPVMNGAFMTYGFGALWFKPIDTNLLHRFDIATGRTTSTGIEGWEELSDFSDQPLAVGAGSMWLRAQDAVIVRIDPSTTRITGTYPADLQGAGGFPLFAFDSLWIANYGADSVWREQIRPSG